MLDSVTNAASGAVGAIGDSPAGGLLDAASSALGGGAPGASPDDAPVEFHIGQPIDPPTTPDRPLDVSPIANGSENPENAVDDSFIEFVHFGMTHSSETVKFPHPKELLGRARQFRDALLREAVLLVGQINSTQHCFEAQEESQGAIGAISDAASMMMGGGSTGPTAADLAAIAEKAGKAAGEVNKEEIVYTKIHKCGMDLHQQRANYNALVEKLADAALKRGGGLMGQGTSMMSQMGSAVGMGGGGGGGASKALEIVAIIQGCLFMPFDISLCMYTKVRAEYEDGINEACHRRSIASIIDETEPTFNIWSPLPPEEEEPEEEEPEREWEDLGPEPSDPIAAAAWRVNKAQQDIEKKRYEAEKKIEETNKKVDDKIAKVNDILAPDAPTDPGPGAAELARIFAMFKGVENDKREPNGALRHRKPLTEVLVDGINTQLKDTVKGGSVPTFMIKVIDKIGVMSVELLQKIYTAAQAGRLGDMDMKSLQKLAREALMDKLIGLAIEKFAWLGEPLMIGGMSSLGGMGKNIDFSQGKAAALEALRNLVVEKTEAPLKVILDQSMYNLADRIMSALAEARVGKHETMEVLYARLPELVVTLFRDTFFPLWHLVLETLWDKAVAPVNAMGNKLYEYKDIAKGKVDDIKAYKDYKVDNYIKGKANEAKQEVWEKAAAADAAVAKAESAASAVGVNLGLGDEGQVTQMAQGLVGDELNELFDPNAGMEQEAPAEPFPGAERVVDGIGKALEEGEDQKVEDEQPTNATPWPDPPGQEEEESSESESAETATAEA